MNSKIQEKIKPFIVMDVLERAIQLEAKGRSIIHMEIGEPDFSTPRRIVEAGISAMREGNTHYTDSRGTEELRSAVASYYNKKYSVNVSSDQVLITMGVSPALLTVLSTLINNHGDEVIIGNPCYPCYPNFIKYLGGVPKSVPARDENGFQPSPDDIKKLANSKTKAIIINSPSNPAGTVIPVEKMREITNLGIPVISDEIYHGLTYGIKDHSTLEFTDNTFVLNGFSKLFAMTGWRLGYIIAPRESVRSIHILQQNFFISPNSFVQKAGVTALTEKHPEIEKMKNTYNKRRLYLIKELPGLGLTFSVEPQGAFYFFVNTETSGMDSYKLAFDILEDAGVAVTPGIDFGRLGEGHLRISYANSMENLAEGVERLKSYFSKRR
jgi:aspartate/methionine/tyrosine aminotransferase